MRGIGSQEKFIDWYKKETKYNEVFKIQEECVAYRVSTLFDTDPLFLKTALKKIEES